MENKQLFEKRANDYNPFFPIVRLEDIIDTISDKSVQWILNNYNHIYVEYSESKAITRNKVPVLLRRKGLWISYNIGKQVITEYYIGDNNDITNYKEWTADINWKKFNEADILDDSITYKHLSESLKQLIGEGNTITNFPDEEDITTNDNMLSFKDRNYEPDKFSGLGKVILRKNIIVIDGQPKNILTQDMVSKENTIYEIRYDFDLNGEEITIPEGCVLDFQGGSLNNGVLNGLVLNEYIKPEWFGAKGNGITDDTKALQNSVNIAKSVILQGHYATSDSVVLRHPILLRGNGGRIECLSKIVKVIKGSSINGLRISDLELKGHCSYETDDESGAVAVEFKDCTDVYIQNCVFSGFNKNIELTECVNCYITDNKINDATETANRINGYGILLESSDNVFISNNKMFNIERHAVYINGGHDILVSNNLIEGQTNNLERYSQWEGNIKICASRDIIVDSNIVKGNFFGISLQKGFDTTFGGANIKIIHNTIKDCIASKSIPHHAIGFPEIGDFENVEISNNTIVLNKESRYYTGIGIEMFAGTNTGELKNIKILDNTCIGCARGFRFVYTADIELTGNVAIDCEYGYDINVGSGVYGEINYYKNCTNVHNFTSFVNSRTFFIKGLLPFNGSKSKIVDGVDACINDVFYNLGSQIVIDNIKNGFADQIIRIVSLSPGSIRVNKSEYLKLKSSSFIPIEQYGEIHLMNNNGTWYEIYRTGDYTLPDSRVSSGTYPQNAGLGYSVYRTDLYKPAFWNGSKWLDALGNPPDALRKGSYEQLPVNVETGFSYFCTNRRTVEGGADGIILYKRGSDWVDALGRIVE